MKNKCQVIVVGGGPAGICAAITIAKAGKEVILIERGAFCGSKNVFGGAIYTRPTKEIFPDFEQTAPLERKITTHNYLIRCEGQELSLAYFNQEENNAYTVIRGKFDRWMQEEAQKAGVVVVTETLVNDLIVENKKIVGVKTELEDYFCDVVILADGVNSILAKKAGLRNDINPEDVALSVKEVIKLDEETINQRFNLKDSEGCSYEILGEPMSNIFGMGFLYTNKNSISIGVGISLKDLARFELRPYDVLEKMKEHPKFKNLLSGGELLEYSAHLIPEGGYHKIPKLFTDGALVVGDAAMLVNSVHFEGTNLAMISGKLAGETVLDAIEKNDFSAKALSNYKKKLEKSFIIKDLKAYKDVIKNVEKRQDSFLGYFPKKIVEFFNLFTNVDSVPKRGKYRKYIKSFFTERSICELFKDGVAMIKAVWGVIIG